MRAAGWHWSGRLAAGVAIAGGAAYLWIVIAQYLYQRDRAPYWDMVTVEYVLGKWQRFPTLHQAFTFRDNEHRPAFPMYVFAIDHFWFASRGLLLILLSMLSIAAACGMCLWRLLPAIRQPASRLAYFLIFPVVMFWPAQHHNFIWPKQFHACFSIFCICTMFALVAGFDPRRPAWRSRELLTLAAILILIFVGAFSFGWGLLAAFVMALFVLWRRWPISRALPVLVTVAATAILYASVSKSLNTGGSYRELGVNMLSALLYLLRFMGAPVSDLVDPDAGPAAMILAQVFAAAGMAGAALLVLRRRRDTTSDPRLAAAMNLADLLLVFTMVCGVLTMKARYLHFSTDATSSRYLFIPALFWLALVFRLAAWRAPVPKLNWIAPILIAAIGAGLAVGTPTYFAIMAERAFNHRLGAVAAVLGENVGVPPRLSTNQSIIQAVFADYAAHGTSVYADPWPHWLGAKAADVVPPDAPACTGAISRGGAVSGSTDRTDSRIDGRIIRPDGSGANSWLAFVNADGSVIGLGTSGSSRLGYPPSAGEFAPWTGFAGYLRGQQSDVAAIYASFGASDWCRLALSQ